MVGSFVRFGLSLVVVTSAIGVGPLSIARLKPDTTYAATAAAAQDPHDHTPAASGVPLGVPYFCADPTTTSVAAGSWSNPSTWSAGRVPGPND